MNGAVFAVLVLLGGAAIALWIEVRFPRLAPRDMRRTMFHVGISIVVAQLVVPAVMHVTAAGGDPVRTLVAIFGIGFPALTYCLLASIWAVKIFQAHLRH